MNRIDRILLALTLLLLLLLGIDQLGPRPGQAPPLLDLAPDAVNEIAVLRDGQLQLALLRDTEGWMLTHPQVARANPQRVATLLGLTRLRSLGRPGDDRPAPFGLAPPRLQLRFNDTELAFGDASVPAGQRYLSLNGQIHLVDDIAYRIASLPDSHYRNAP